MMNAALDSISRAVGKPRQADSSVFQLASALGSTIAEATALSELQHEKAKLDGALVHVEMQVEQLGAALLHVLRPPVNVEDIKRTATGSDTTEPARAPFLHDIHYTTERVIRLSAALDALQGRLAV